MGMLQRLLGRLYEIRNGRQLTLTGQPRIGLGQEVLEVELYQIAHDRVQLGLGEKDPDSVQRQKRLLRLLDL